MRKFLLLVSVSLGWLLARAVKVGVQQEGEIERWKVRYLCERLRNEIREDQFLPQPEEAQPPQVIEAPQPEQK